MSQAMANSRILLWSNLVWYAMKDCAVGESCNSAVPESDRPRALVRLLTAPLKFAMLEVYP
jgi:hypothetical protein